jgi:hypothetical protein
MGNGGLKPCIVNSVEILEQVQELVWICAGDINLLQNRYGNPFLG